MTTNNIEPKVTAKINMNIADMTEEQQKNNDFSGDYNTVKAELKKMGFTCK